MKNEWHQVRLHIDHIREICVSLGFFKKETGFDDASLKKYLWEIVETYDSEEE